MVLIVAKTNDEDGCCGGINSNESEQWAKTTKVEYKKAPRKLKDAGVVVA